MTNADFLNRVGEILGEREANYGFCEEHFARTVAMVNAALGTNMTAKDWPIVMLCDKLARNGGPSFTADTVYDLAGYATLLARLTDTSKDESHGRNHGKSATAGTGSVPAETGPVRADQPGHGKGSGVCRHDVARKPPPRAIVPKQIPPRSGVEAGSDRLQKRAVAASRHDNARQKAGSTLRNLVIDMVLMLLVLSGVAVTAVVVADMFLIFGAGFFFNGGKFGL